MLAPLPLPIPTNILDAEQALCTFDITSSVGPKLSCTRFKLFARLRKYYVKNEWEWVADILDPEGKGRGCVNILKRRAGDASTHSGEGQDGRMLSLTHSVPLGAPAPGG